MSCPVAGPRSIVSAPLFDPVAGHDVSKACQGEHDRSQGVDGGRDARDDGPEADHEEERSVIPLPRPPRAEPLGPFGPLLTGMRLTPRQQPRERNLEARRHALKLRYYERFRSVLPVKTAARFLQVENQILLLMDLQIAASLPIASR